jgi:membrane protein
MLDIARWVITLILVYSVNTTLYNVGMGVRRRRSWRFWNSGAILATSLFIITSLAFAYFINNFSQFNKLYGSLGTLMVLLIWMNLNCIILLAGFDLNASIRKALRTMHQMKEEKLKETAVVIEDKIESTPEQIKNTFKS